MTVHDKYAVMGFPVVHSLSPLMHNAWFAEMGMPAEYGTIEVHNLTTASLRDVMDTHGVRGVNLTVPLKEEACSQVDVLDPSAAQAGAVNTALIRDGVLYGYNTDGDGFCRGIRHEVGDIGADPLVVILGAGGAARGILAALIRQGVTRFVVLNRTANTAMALVQQFSGQGVTMDTGGLTPADFCRLGRSADVVVHTTSGEGARRVSGFPVDHLSPRATWVDINYWMDPPPKMQDWAHRQGRFVTGHSMLIWQAALAFELFTGFLPNPSPFLHQLR